jgi:hypothetical protein
MVGAKAASSHIVGNGAKCSGVVKEDARKVRRRASPAVMGDFLCNQTSVKVCAVLRRLLQAMKMAVVVVDVTWLTDDATAEGAKIVGIDKRQISMSRT